MKSFSSAKEVGVTELYGFYLTGLDNCCGYSGGTFYAGPVITFKEAKRGNWGAGFASGCTD